MLAEELINVATPILRPTDSVGRAIELMEESGLHQLPLVDDETYQGLLSEETLMNVMDDDKELSSLYLPSEPLHATTNQHIYQLIELANHYQLDTIPVLDEDHLYAGTIIVSELIAKFADLLGGQQKGAVVVLSMAHRDYSLSEISRLIESNNAKIISSYFTHSETGGFDDNKLTLKLNQTDVSAILATFERFGYEIDSVYANTQVESPDKHRLDLLFRYLET